MKDLIESMKQGDRRALSRLLSYVEDRDERAFELLQKIWPQTGRAFVVGITGSAGAGKSTLIDQLISTLRGNKKKVGVVAIDPSSPFSGGAVLGDRIRMQRHASDSDVFIRSVSSRGRSGGISFSTRAVVQVLDAFGVDVILVETVGAGQSEIDIVDIVDTVVVVLGPESGDSVQTLKAGILEIADVFVVNKKDLDGAVRVVSDIGSMLSLKPNADGWTPPIVLTEGRSGEGVDAVWRAIESHRAELRKKGMASGERLRRHLHELAEIIEAKLAVDVMMYCQKDEKLKAELTKETRPNLYAVAERVLSESGRLGPRRK
ncbi:MAG TPA: methylmalonyl Co-A mutase-associated GTPase MeaB [Bdellovibrionota bacterium]|nr:methylmalonyl Co-A mutase-associated GTPase MeaB [Bdellovibrionota bacterium]